MRALLFALFATTASAAPTIEGAPHYTADRLGGGVADFGSTFAIKAETTGARENRLAAFEFHDARPGAVRDSPLGSFSLVVSDAASMPRLQARTVTFSPWGWREDAGDGLHHAEVRVFTLRRNVFAVVATITTDAAPLTIEARIEGSLTASNATAQAMVDRLVIDNGEGRPFGVAWSSTGTAKSVSSSGGKSYSATARFEVNGVQQLGFLIAFHADPAKAAQLVTPVPGDPGKWHEPIEADWAGFLSSGTKPHLGFPPTGKREDELAKTLLRMNQIADDNGVVLGGSPAKTHYNHFWVWDSAFQALGVSEYSSTLARAELDALFRAQLTSGDEAGIIPNHVDEKGVPPLVGVPGFADLYSQSPAFGLAIRPVYERSTPDDASRAWLQNAYDVSGRYIDWWFRRRDKDGDGFVESNGGWEGGADNSPRFTEIWGDSIIARLPVPDSDPRPRLNAVDMAAWLYLYEVEQARIAEHLGALEDAQAWRDRARSLAEKIEGESSFWDPARGGYFDFVRGTTGSQRFVKTHTPVTWFPLFAGTTRDPARVEQLVATITDPAKYWGEHGIPSVAFDDPSFDAHEYWRGPSWINYGYFTAIALSRYGYDDEAEILKQRLLELPANKDSHWEYYDSKTGEGINVMQLGWSGALHMELLRDRHQAEAFDVSRAQPAKSRKGFFQRLTRLADGVDLVRIAVAGSAGVPKTLVASEAVLFTTEPVTLTFEDPFLVIGPSDVLVTFPSLESARIELTRDGVVTTPEFAAGGTISARVGDKVRVSDYRFIGAPKGCGCTSTSPAALLALGVFVLGRLARTRSRSAS